MAKNGNSEKNTKGDSGKNTKNEYTVKMAILDNLDNDFIPLKTLCDRIEKQDKLPSIHTNDGWKRTISTALISLVANKTVIVDNHQYKLA